MEGSVYAVKENKYAVAVQKLLRNVTLNPKHQLYGNINFDDIFKVIHPKYYKHLKKAAQHSQLGK